MDEAEFQTLAGFAVAESDGTAKLARAVGAISRGSETGLGGAKVESAGGKAFEAEGAGAVCAGGGPGSGRAMPGDCNNRLMYGIAAGSIDDDT